jgi:hypothetical protein
VRERLSHLAATSGGALPAAADRDRHDNRIGKPMSVPLPAMVSRVWAKCRTPARADLPHDVGDNTLGAIQTPLPFLDESLDPAQPPFGASEATEPPSGTPEIAAVQNPADAEQLVVDLTQVMDGLIAVVEQETNLIRAGRADVPTQVEQSKADLARRYSADIARLQRSRLYLCQMMPMSFAVLHHRHETFRALLQVNLTLLAIERGAAAAPVDDLAAEAPVDDLSGESARTSNAPHRPRPDRAHLPRLPRARRCSRPRKSSPVTQKRPLVRFADFG